MPILIVSIWSSIPAVLPLGQTIHLIAEVAEVRLVRRGQCVITHLHTPHIQ